MYKLHIELLEKAKEYLWDGVGVPSDGRGYRTATRYVCYAVAEACKPFKRNSGLIAECLKDAVLSRMPGSSVYTDYLRQRAAMGLGMYPEDMSSQEIQSMRLALIDDIIAHYTQLQTQGEAA